jgi:hypothetical protein
MPRHTDHAASGPVLTASLALALALLPATAARAQPDDGAATALEAYERGHYAAAFALYARRAEAGDCDAARVALLMLRLGPTLYGQRFEPPSAAAPARWRLLAGATRP